jgi:predicted ATPase
MPAKLKSLTIEGFKTFKSLTFEPRSLNVLIGANGAGKSNFLSFLQFLSDMLDPAEGLRMHVGTHGKAKALLHDGPRVTREMKCKVAVVGDSGQGAEYEFALRWGNEDDLTFVDEKYRFQWGGRKNANEAADPDWWERSGMWTDWTEMGAGHAEPRLDPAFADQSEHAGQMWPLKEYLRSFAIYHFQDTSSLSPMRMACERGNNVRLMRDGANLPAFLMRLRDSGRADEKRAFQAVQETISLAYRQFAEFVLDPKDESPLLRWREKGSNDYVFSVGQAPDGLLRFMAITTLLRQPKDLMPDIVLLDEPELGLHPDALSLVAGMIRSAAAVRQVIIATQSPTLLCEFEPADVVVVERKERESQFVRLDEEELCYWLKEYSLGDLWQKGWFGGGPFA